MSDKILIIANKPPYPSIDGGCFAMAKFEQLVRKTGSDIFYFAISTPKHPFQENSWPKPWELNKNLFTEFINTGVRNKHVLKYLAGSSIRAVRFYTRSCEEKILNIIKEKNINTVIFESIYAAVYLRSIQKNTGAKTYIRAHNIEHKIWERFYDGMPRGLKKLAYKSETTRLIGFENDCLEACTGNIFISDDDEHHYRTELNKTNSIVIPLQMDPAPPVNRDKQIPLELFHLGAMDWLPNVEGVTHLMTSIYPAIHEAHSNIKLHLAGKAMPQEFYEYASDHVTVEGKIEDAQSFISKYDVLVVPIRSVSGIRIKILEAMAAGKPVISTSAGIEGINAVSGTHFLLANEPGEWIKAIEFLSVSSQYNMIANNALSYIRENYSELTLLKKLETFIKNNH